MSNSEYALAKENSGSEPLTAEHASNALGSKKKPYVTPQITEPQGLLETTKFFFQAAAGGSSLQSEPGHGNQLLS